MATLRIGGSALVIEADGVRLTMDKSSITVESGAAVCRLDESGISLAGSIALGGRVPNF